MHCCIRKQNFGKSTVCFSVHLPPRLSLLALESVGDCRHSGEAAEVSKITESWQVSGTLGMGVDRGTQATALSTGTTQRFHMLLDHGWRPVIILIDRNYHPGEHLLVDLEGGGWRGGS